MGIRKHENTGTVRVEVGNMTRKVIRPSQRTKDARLLGTLGQTPQQMVERQREKTFAGLVRKHVMAALKESKS